MEPERWRRVKDICNAALDHAPSGREAFINTACGGDEVLRAEVTDLLSRARGLEAFLEAAPAVPQTTPAEDRAISLDVPGDTILYYAIAEKIGEGGMGVVYRAQDTRLGRWVALKFLPEALSGDKQALDRFRREARSVSALNHPRVCTLYDVGEHDGRAFLVLEYLDGQTLAALLATGALPLKRALDIAVQIAEGLEAAHAHGIVHRDLKPGNVMVTATGVKLLDFGLAKPTGATVATRSPQGEPVSVTDSALIMGTIPYMAPEQLEGRPVDARTDIWALGTILYEMVAGRRAFDAPSQASLIASILDREPPALATVEPLTPPLLDHVVARCLAKSLDERWGSAHDVAHVLRWIRDGGTHRPPAAAPRHSAWWKPVVVGGVGLLLVAAFGAIIRLSTPRIRSVPAPSRLFTITLPPDKPLAPLGMMPEAADRPALALSRDGTRLAYAARIGDTTQLCIRDMTSTGIVVPLPGTEGGHSPFFSPGGAFVAFFAEGKLKKTASRGGAVVSLADAPNPYGGTWADDDWIYFARHSQEGIHRIKADGGAVEVVTAGLARMPEVLPAGKGLLATVGEGTFRVDAAGKRTLIVRGYGARFVAPSHLLYALPGRLVASTFDAGQARVIGPGVTLAADLRTAPYGVAQFAFANDGTLVYAPGRPQTMTSFVWVDRLGRTRPAGLPEATYSTFDLSPDGARLVFGLESADGRVTQLWLFDLQRQRKSSLTARVTAGEETWNAYPRWTPDGRGVVYTRRPKDNVFQLALQFVAGSAEPTTLWTNTRGQPGNLMPMSFTPDGRAMIAFGPIRPGGFDIVRFVRDEGGGLWTKGPDTVLATPYSEYFGEVSPDGRWLLFTSDQSGRNEIYVTSYRTPGVVHKVSRDGGHKAAWNGVSEIVYKFGMEMHAVAVTPRPEFRAGEPRLLFAGAFPNIPGFDFAVAPGGREFLMLENKDVLQPATTLTVITHVFDELERRLPAGGR